MQQTSSPNEDVNDAPAELERARRVSRRTRSITLGLIGLLLVVVVALAIFNQFNSPSFSSAENQTALAGLGTSMADLVTVGSALQTATSAAATQAKQDQLATNEAHLTATNVVSTQESQAQLATSAASLAATDVPNPPSEPATILSAMLPVEPVTANADWTPLYQSFEGVEMAFVPAGCFMMGSEEGSDDEKHVHEQCFDQPFWIDRYEVTNDQYGSEAFFEGDNHPRDSVTWAEARDFCAARDGRLPTEREWEYAARGPDNLLYPWGDDLTDEPAVHASNSNEESADVGSLPAGNSWVGASDMSGNLWEWVSSLYLSYDSQDDRENPDLDAGFRVLRGGSWGLDSSALSATYRGGGADPTEVNNEYGFRCARDAESAPLQDYPLLGMGGNPVPFNALWQPVYRMFDGVEMALVPVGCFMMGVDGGEEDQSPAHEQCFDEPFWIDRYEVTNLQTQSSGVFSGDNRPRDTISWYVARDWCAARDARLPTEREWEYAARGPDNLVYPWGNEFISANVVGSENADNQTADVGERKGASWVGTSDMSGNLLEWVSSRFERYPYDASDGREEDSDDDDVQRVLRGGSYTENAHEAALRFADYPMNAYVNFGFRCARDY